MKAKTKVQNFIKNEVTSDFSKIVSHPANRPGSFDQKIADEMGWNESGMNEFKRRVARIKKLIREHGVLPFSCLIIGVLDEKNYIIDGQSRKVAIEELNKELEESGNPERYEIEVRYYKYNSEREMIKHMEISNTYHKNWTSHQKTNAHIEADYSGVYKTQLKESQKKIEEYSRLTGMAISTIKDVMFGMNASKTERVGTCNIFGDTYWKYSPLFMNDIIELNKASHGNELFDGKLKKLCTVERFVAGFRILHNRIENYSCDHITKKRLHKELTKRIAEYIGSCDQFKAHQQLKFGSVPQAELTLRSIALKGLKRSNKLYDVLG